MCIPSLYISTQSRILSTFNFPRFVSPYVHTPRLHYTISYPPHRRQTISARDDEVGVMSTDASETEINP